MIYPNPRKYGTVVYLVFGPCRRYIISSTLILGARPSGTASCNPGGMIVKLSRGRNTEFILKRWICNYPYTHKIEIRLTMEVFLYSGLSGHSGIGADISEPQTFLPYEALATEVSHICILEASGEIYMIATSGIVIMIRASGCLLHIVGHLGLQRLPLKGACS